MKKIIMEKIFNFRLFANKNQIDFLKKYSFGNGVEIALSFISKEDEYILNELKHAGFLTSFEGSHVYLTTTLIGDQLLAQLNN